MNNDSKLGVISKSEKVSTFHGVQDWSEGSVTRVSGSPFAQSVN